MKAVRVIIFLAVTIVFLLAGGMADVQAAGFEGNSNTFLGTGAGAVTTGDNDRDTFIGAYAGWYNTTGSENTFLGHWAGLYNITAVGNTFLGHYAGLNNNYSNTGGNTNTFVGSYTGYSNTEGSENTFLGHVAGYSNTVGNYNTFSGHGAGYSNATGFQNTFLGHSAGYSNTTSYYNTFLGNFAGYSNTTGYANTFLGRSAGYSNTTGSGNVFIGVGAGYAETGSDKLYIDNSITTAPLIYGEFDNRKLKVNGNLEVIGPDNGLVRLSNVTTDATTKVARMVVNHYSNSQLPVYLFGAASTATNNFVALGGGNTIGNAATQIDLFTAPNTTTPVGTPRLTIKSDGKVGIGTQTPSQQLYVVGNIYATGNVSWGSSRELKENIRELTVNEAVTALDSLQPQKYYYKADNRDEHIGFIAEDVPQLVATGDRKSLDPMDIVAVLTSVVKQQQKISEEQQKTMEEQQKIIANLAEKVTDLERELRLKGTLAKSEYLP